MKMFTVYCMILLYGLNQLSSDYTEQPFEANMIMTINLIAVVCLIIAR